jgi:hypothetical protein
MTFAEEMDPMSQVLLCMEAFSIMDVMCSRPQGTDYLNNTIAIRVWLLTCFLNTQMQDLTLELETVRYEMSNSKTRCCQTRVCI